MASPFKIPKKKHPAGSDSTEMKMHSPLSRLQDSAPQSKMGFGDSSRGGGGGEGRMHAGNKLSSTKDKQSTPCKPLFRDVVKTLLGLNSPNTGGSSTTNQPSPGRSIHQSHTGRRSSSDCLSKGWRPKRASDRLLQPEGASDDLCPPHKKIELNGSSSSTKSISVLSVDSLADLRGEKPVGSVSLSPLRVGMWSRGRSNAEAKSDCSESPQKKNLYLSSSDQSSEDDFVSVRGTTNKSPAGNPLPRRSSSSPSASSVKPQTKHTLDRTSWLSACNNLTEDLREKERQRWKDFRDRKMSNRSAVLGLRLKKSRPSQTEPIVLSSEEEEEDSGGGAKRTSQIPSSRVEDSCPGNSKTLQAGGGVHEPPSFLQLEFTSFHAGLAHMTANGNVMVSEHAIIIPLKGAEDAEDAEVTVVASQVRGYGLWDGGVARGGSLLAAWEGPAPSLLFLWVSDAQANLLHKELCSIQTGMSASGPCSCLLLVLKEQLPELQAALLASVLDMDGYQSGRATSTGPTSPIDWTDGLLLFHSCPPPLDQHLLKLLGHTAEQSSLVRSSCRMSGLQQRCSRLIQYPAPPCKGRITVTKEDLACLNSGQFLNDVIIDFYLKYLILEGVRGSVAERSHVFSSFFYKQLSRRKAAGEDGSPSVPDRYTRHQRVKTWTRNVDIFSKDFLFVPVNQEAHWFLVVVCFPGLEDVQYKEFQRHPGGSQQEAGKTSTFSLRSQQLPQCTQQGCQRDSEVLQRPCILVMDSLKMSYHENVCRLLRDYLQVEWAVRRGTPRLITPDNMRISKCRVPLQDNSSDCGLYLLQYAESFLQNPIVHFDLPLSLDAWFPRQHVRQKREEIRSLIMRMHQSQRHEQS